MNSVEISAKTLDEAIEEGLKTLGVKRENVDVQILSEPAQGLLKLWSSKPARVKLSVLRGPEEYMRFFLQELIENMGVRGEVVLQTPEEAVNGSLTHLLFEVNGENLGVLIGKRGSTLNAIQYLANVVLQRQFPLERARVLLDIENYRLKRKKTLEHLAKSLASKVSRTRQEVVLEPMTPQERRIIHICLKDEKDVVTSSQGQEPYRKVVIAPR